MLYYTHEVQASKLVQHTAGIKARDDVEKILENIGAKNLDIYISNEATDSRGYWKKVAGQFQAGLEWKKKLKKLKKGDLLLIQCPAINHSVLLGEELKKARQKGIKIALLLHDMEILRSAGRKDSSFSRRLRINVEERSVLKECDFIIAHNHAMKKTLIDLGVEEKKIVILEIFDYLMPDNKDLHFSKIGKEMPIIIAGNLREYKAKYVYNLPPNCDFNLYGVDYTGITNERIRYFGAFPPEALIDEMEGSFGLVWDGESPHTCTGVYGDYLRINNPHKTSLYLACGIPVVIWDKAALADFVIKNNCGIVVRSLAEISEVVANIDDDMYEKLSENARRVGRLMRNGSFLIKSIHEINNSI